MQFDTDDVLNIIARHLIKTDGGVRQNSIINTLILALESANDEETLLVLRKALEEALKSAVES